LKLKIYILKLASFAHKFCSKWWTNSKRNHSKDNFYPRNLLKLLGIVELAMKSANHISVLLTLNFWLSFQKTYLFCKESPRLLLKPVKSDQQERSTNTLICMMNKFHFLHFCRENISVIFLIRGCQSKNLLISPLLLLTRKELLFS